RDGHVTGVQTCALPISEAFRVLDLPSLLRGHTPVASRRSRKASAIRGRVHDAFRPLGLGRTQTWVAPSCSGWGPMAARGRPEAEIGRASCRERGEGAGV